MTHQRHPHVGAFPHPSCLSFPKGFNQAVSNGSWHPDPQNTLRNPHLQQKNRDVWALGGAWRAPEFQEHQIPALLIPRQEQPCSSRGWDPAHSSPPAPSTQISPLPLDCGWVQMETSPSQRAKPYVELGRDTLRFFPLFKLFKETRIQHKNGRQKMRLSTFAMVCSTLEVNESLEMVNESLERPGPFQELWSSPPLV